MTQLYFMRKLKKVNFLHQVLIDFYRGAIETNSDWDHHNLPWCTAQITGTINRAPVRWDVCTEPSGHLNSTEPPSDKRYRSIWARGWSQLVFVLFCFSLLDRIFRVWGYFCRVRSGRPQRLIFRECGLFILLTFQRHLGSRTLLKPDWSISAENISKNLIVTSKYVFLRETYPSAAL